MKSYITLVRVGNLSKTDYKDFYKSDSFHSPPVKKGIYCFIWPHIEHFLWVWKFKNSENLNKTYKLNAKKIKYSGDLWCHFVEEAHQYGRGIKFSKEWVKVSLEDYLFLFKKAKHNDAKFAVEGYTERGWEVRKQGDPYHRGRTGNIPVSKDHLEVFIEKIN